MIPEGLTKGKLFTSLAKPSDPRELKLESKQAKERSRSHAISEPPRSEGLEEIRRSGITEITAERSFWLGSESLSPWLLSVFSVINDCGPVGPPILCLCLISQRISSCSDSASKRASGIEVFNINLWGSVLALQPINLKSTINDLGV